ncbi:hypothetical protein ACFQ60_00090 [Streptomyces zhihengii]
MWLNEAQHYLGDREFGERIAAAVHHLLIDEQRGPVLVLGTLWPEYAHDYTALPHRYKGDPHSRVRELLADHTVSVPDTFDTGALAAAEALADRGDALLADALTRAGTAAGSRRIWPGHLNSCAATNNPARPPPAPCWKRRWTPAGSAWASTFSRPS